MNKYWPKKWHDKIPNFLGEDFFSSFDFIEEEANSNENQTDQPKRIKNNGSSVKVNICESNNQLLCIFRAPGLNLEDVEIDVYDKTLEIIGTVSVDHKGLSPIHMELYQGPIIRKVQLPYPAHHDKIEAAYQDGYLYVWLHRLIRSKETRQKLAIKNFEENKDTSHDL
ncbi:Hsp20/alpha crystallin family protein [Amphibacillus cookii]|uniref:Hsp20/alpha crystallin family protein n=1 Tax=Amphibacillus cookii TaxID=767787 RepID=UPI001958C507|nr:Hsp20 family protein [Amphibacillus cookii]MBM7542362.1 HSP20 family molecular chaperone IbpA [Amphibacillus cookii]